MTMGISSNYQYGNYPTTFPQYNANAQAKTAFGNSMQYGEEKKEGSTLGSIAKWGTILAVGAAIADVACCGGKHLKSIYKWIKGSEKTLTSGVTRRFANVEGGAKLAQITNKEGKIIQEHLIKDGKVISRKTLDSATGAVKTSYTAEQVAERAKLAKKYTDAKVALAKFKANNGTLLGNPEKLAELEKAVADAKAEIVNVKPLATSVKPAPVPTPTPVAPTPAPVAPTPAPVAPKVTAKADEIYTEVECPQFITGEKITTKAPAMPKSAEALKITKKPVLIHDGKGGYRLIYQQTGITPDMPLGCA